MFQKSSLVAASVCFGLSIFRFLYLVFFFCLCYINDAVHRHQSKQQGKSKEQMYNKQDLLSFTDAYLLI